MRHASLDMNVNYNFFSGGWVLSKMCWHKKIKVNFCFVHSYDSLALLVSELWRKTQNHPTSGAVYP